MAAGRRSRLVVHHSLVARLSVAAELSDAERDLIIRDTSASVRRKAGVVVSEEGSPNNWVHAVLDGVACRYKQLSDGRRQITSFILPGDFCDWRTPALRWTDHGILTLTPCTMIALDPTTIERWSKYPALRHALSWAGLVEEAILREWIVNLGARDAVTRTGHLFCEIFSRLTIVGLSRPDGFDARLTQEVLAQALGLSLVHMNRSMKRLRDLGLMTFREGRVEIHELDKLKAVSDFDPAYLHLQGLRRPVHSV